MIFHRALAQPGFGAIAEFKRRSPSAGDLRPDGNVQQATAMRRSRDVRDAKDRGAAEEVASALVPKVITVKAKAGAEGRLFGSVTSVDVATAVQEQTGIELDRRKLHLDEPIKSLGTHQVSTRLHPEVEFAITVEVVST